MPLPTPRKKEEEDAFVSRCMGDETMLKEFPKQKQRAGVCYNLYERAKKKKDKESKGSENDAITWENSDFKVKGWMTF